MRMTLPPNQVSRLTLDQAAAFLSIPPTAVEGLVRAGYLAARSPAADESASRPPAELEFTMADVKAFLARNDANGAGNLSLDALHSADPRALLDALDGRSEEMAQRALDIFATVFPEADDWSPNERARFVGQARHRFEAILAVTGQGAAVDDALVGDLQDVGAAAAAAESPLPQLLVILRISRDLVVQTAVELAEQRGGHWGLALSLLLTRILPAMDRLTDALAQGYWAALAGREEELRDRYEHVIETSSSGAYEVDLDGRIKYANPALCTMLGRSGEQLLGTPLGGVLVPLDAGVSVEALQRPTGTECDRIELAVARADGVRRVLEIRAMARYRFGELVGHQGVVRDITSEHDLDADRSEFVALVSHDLRRPLAMLAGQGANLEAHATEFPADQVARIGAAIRRQAERISRLTDDLADVAQLGTSDLAVTSRRADLAQVVGAALQSVRSPADVDVRIPPDVVVRIDPRRLEQVVANVVDNGLANGGGRVVIELARAEAGLVEFTVCDFGPGVPEDEIPALFAGPRHPGNSSGSRAGYRSILGLSLARALVEAMGGRIAYEPGREGGACFRLTVPS